MKKMFNKKYIIFIILVTIIVLLINLILFFNPFVYFKVDGAKSFIVEVNEDFSLPLIKAYIFNNDISKNIKKKVVLTAEKLGNI